MLNQKNQNGFSAVEAILIIVVIGIIGFAGWFVYNSQKSTDKTLSDSNKSQTAQAPAKSTPAQKDEVSPADTSTDGKEVEYSKLPASFKIAYVAYAKSSTGTCVDANGNPLNDEGKAYDPYAKYVTNKFVRVGVCNASAIFAYKNGSWMFVAKTIYIYDCADLKKYAVPYVIVSNGNGAECLDTDNNAMEYAE